MTKIAIKTQSATNLIAYGGAAVVDGLLRPFSIDSLIDQELVSDLLVSCFHNPTPTCASLAY